MEDVILLFPGYSESMKMGYNFQRKMVFVPLKMLKCISIVVSRFFSLQSRSSTCKKIKATSLLLGSNIMRISIQLRKQAMPQVAEMISSTSGIV